MPQIMPTPWRQGLACLLFSLLAACAHGRIPSTDIPDTKDNRAVYDLVGQYREALEALDADAILALVSPNYYESNGNSDPSDDYDFAGLQAHLKEDLAHTKRIIANFRIDGLEVDGDKAWVEVYYLLRTHNSYPAGDKWDSVRDRTRIRFVRENEDAPWRIVAGL